MNIKRNWKKILGFAAIAGLLFVTAPTERAQAASLNGPGIAAAVQGDVAGTTQVRYGHHGYRHHGWGRPHHRFHRHHHWRRPHFVHRHHWHGRRHHYRY